MPGTESNDIRPAVIYSQTVKRLAIDLGADTVGIAPAIPVRNPDRLYSWLKKGYSGSMTYLARNIEQRLDPTLLFPEAVSIIVIGVNYFPSPGDIAAQNTPFKVAQYAWGEDYHHILRRLLRRLRKNLQDFDPGLKGYICVDTAPFMDKYWAQMAGLGWIGKHSNLVSRQFGSWLTIGSLIINSRVDTYDLPHQDHCGHCNGCVEVCPTGAIAEPYILNASRCLSYWTIESKAETFPACIKDNLRGWVFGCDICLKACPFNRFKRAHKLESFSRRQETALLESGQAAELTEMDFRNSFAHTAILRTKLSGIKRNIFLALKQ